MSPTATITVTVPMGSYCDYLEELQRIGGKLTPLEVQEFLTICPQIFYFKQRAGTHGWHDQSGHYIAITDEHLMFRYRVMGVISKGGFGQVLLCFDHKTGKEVAVKMLKHESKVCADSYMPELGINLALQAEKGSPKIVPFLNCFHFRGHTCFVFQLIRGGDLSKHIPWTGLPLEDVRKFTRSILEGLLFLKRCGLIHMDIKPLNILVTDRAAGQTCLADFGLSFWKDNQCCNRNGTPGYLSPEVYLDQPLTCATDMWALGCVVAEMVIGGRLFNASHNGCLQEFVHVLGLPPRNIVHASGKRIDLAGGPVFLGRGIVKVNPPPLAQKLKRVTDYGFIDFVRSCLAWDPANRLTPKEALKHPWLTGGGVATLPQPPVTSVSSPVICTQSKIILVASRGSSVSPSVTPAVPSVTPVPPPVSSASSSVTSASSSVTSASSSVTSSSDDTLVASRGSSVSPSVTPAVSSVTPVPPPVNSVSPSVTSTSLPEDMEEVEEVDKVEATVSAGASGAPRQGRFSRVRRRLREMLRSLAGCCVRRQNRVSPF